MVDGAEQKFNRKLPGLSQNGRILLRYTDTFDATTVLKPYIITRVFFDIYAPVPSQLVYLQDYEDGTE